MGRLVLIPPKVRTLAEGGGSKHAPVMFNNDPTDSDGNSTFGSVVVQNTITVVHDPMDAYSSFINFGKYQVGAKGISSHSGIYSPWTSSLAVEELRVKFWDFEELETFVRDNFVGMMMVQYDVDSYRWNFIVCNPTDSSTWNTRISQHKAIEVAVDRRLQSLVHAWLKAECGVFDILDVDRYGSSYIRVFVRDDDEALYFKMRWAGVDVEKELQSS